MKLIDLIEKYDDEQRARIIELEKEVARLRQKPSVVFDGHEFLRSCYSGPLTVADLKPGEMFIAFPCDGDDSGHGGFKSGGRVKIKIEPFHPGKGYHESYLNTCRDLATDNVESYPLTMPVIKLYL